MSPVAQVGSEHLAFHLLALGIKPAAADGRDVALGITTTDPRLDRQPGGRPELEPHPWGGWSLRYQATLRVHVDLWCVSTHRTALPRRIRVRLIDRQEMADELAAIEFEVDPVVRAQKLADLDRRRSIPLTVLLSPDAALLDGVSAFRGRGPAWARLIARSAPSSTVIGIGQCSGNGSFVLPVHPDPLQVPGTTIGVWVDVHAPAGDYRDPWFPPFEPIDLRRVDENDVVIPSSEALLRGTDPGPSFDAGIGELHTMVVGDPASTDLLDLTSH